MKRAAHGEPAAGTEVVGPGARGASSEGARPVADAPATVRPESRAARRKRATEVRLLDAAFTVFCERGYDGATTGEMARVADVAAGTFYLHFRDKRAAYEKLAARTAHELLERWRDALPASASRPERVRLALELTAQFWREHLDLARLLLEGGPSLGSETHLRFVDEIAEILAQAPEAGGDLRSSRTYALVAAGLGIELGRLVVGEAPIGDAAALDEQIRSLIELFAPPAPR